MTWQRPRKGRISTGSCLIDSSNRMQVHLPSSPSKLDVNLSPTASLMLEQRSPQQLWNAKTCENIPLVGNGATLRSWGRVTGFPARKLVRLSATMSMSLCLSGNWDVFWGHLCAWPLKSHDLWIGAMLGALRAPCSTWSTTNKILHFATFVCNMWFEKTWSTLFTPWKFFTVRPWKSYYIPKGKSSSNKQFFGGKLAVKLRGCIFTAWLSAGTELMTGPRTRLFGIWGTSNVGEWREYTIVYMFRIISTYDIWCIIYIYTCIILIYAFKVSK